MPGGVEVTSELRRPMKRLQAPKTTRVTPPYAARVPGHVTALSPGTRGHFLQEVPVSAKDVKLDAPTWAAYQRLDEKYQTLLTNMNEVKRLLKTCGHKEEVHTVKMLKELCGVR